MFRTLRSQPLTLFLTSVFLCDACFAHRHLYWSRVPSNHVCLSSVSLRSIGVYLPTKFFNIERRQTIIACWRTPIISIPTSAWAFLILLAFASVCTIMDDGLTVRICIKRIVEFFTFVVTQADSTCDDKSGAGADILGWLAFAR